MLTITEAYEAGGKKIQWQTARRVRKKKTGSAWNQFELQQTVEEVKDVCGSKAQRRVQGVATEWRKQTTYDEIPGRHRCTGIRYVSKNPKGIED